MSKYVIGLDYSTDSVYALLVNAETGETVAVSQKEYPRFKKGLYCDAAKNKWRHHPQDYLDVLESSVQELVKVCSEDVVKNIVGIAFDTTGSTPAFTDAKGRPLALLPELRDNPDAMFLLWKDHTAIKEAEEINALCRKWHTDYTKYVGGIYSAEWYWAKAIHILREDDLIATMAYSIIEACEWLPAVVTGISHASDVMHSRCACGHKAMWNAEWGGLPPEDFFLALEPKLANIRSQAYIDTYTADKPVGHLSPEWAEKLGLSTSVVVAGGAYDCHMGAVGAGVRENTLVRVIGPSTCDVMVAPMDEIGKRCISGICGQVEGSVIPGMIGLEAGQSAFGDIFELLFSILDYPLQNILPSVLAATKHTDEDVERIKMMIRKIMMEKLSIEAEAIRPYETSTLATDWLNGRRSPDANQSLTGTICGLSLGTTAPHLFRAVVEATAYGSRAIIDRFESEGLRIENVIGIGKIALSMPFVMQTMCDVINKPIRIANTDNACALGAAMFAATAAGVHSDIRHAISAMNSGFIREYHPIMANVEIYSKKFQEYLELGRFSEHVAKSK